MSLVRFPGAASPERPPIESEEDVDGARMSFLDHLDELRRRLIICLASIVVGFLVAFAFIGRVFEFMMRPLQEVLPEGGRLIYTEPAEAFLLYMKVAALLGLLLALPMVMLQIWLFVAPGLYTKEKRLAIPFVFFSTAFFLAGALFSHFFVFPWAWRFFAGFSTDYMQFMPKIGPVFGLYVKMALAMGVVFEMPTVVFFLARIGLVTPRFLIRNTKYAVLAIFVIAAVMTPGPDVVSQALMAGPMVVLYGISILVAWAFQKRRDPEE
jgi:sec-independent protein translocase protein TatC